VVPSPPNVVPDVLIGRPLQLLMAENQAAIEAVLAMDRRVGLRPPRDDNFQLWSG